MSCFPVGAFLLLVACINAQLPDKIDGPKNLDDAIVVIGGGISAIHMSILLRNKGYNNVTVLVEGNRLGGDDVYSRSHRGTIHEMGRHMFIPAMMSEDFDEIMRTFNQGQMKEVSLPTVWEMNAKREKIGKSLDEFMMQKLRENIPGTRDEVLKTSLMNLVRRFDEEVTSLVGEREDMFAEPSWEKKFQLGGSFQDFLVRRRLDGLIPLFTFLFGSMGYGRMKDIPAYYGIFFFKRKLLSGLRQRMQSNAGLRGIPGFKMDPNGMESLLEKAARQVNVKRNIRVDDIELREAAHMKHRINMNDNGVQKDGYYDFVIFADDLRKYVALNRERSQREYQQFLRVGTKYVIKTLVDSLNIPRGLTPVEFYADTFQSAESTDYKLAYSIDSFATKNDRSGDAYQRNLFGNSDDPNDQKRSFKSSVYTQMSQSEPNVAEANRQLLSELRSVGGTNLTVVDTKIYKFFPCYTDRDLNNGMLYEIMKMQGKNGVWYLGQNVFLDSLVHMVAYNKMLISKMISA